MTAGGACYRCTLANSHVPKFTCRSSHSVIDLTIKNDPCAKPLFNQDENEIAPMANLRSAKPQLSQSSGIRIIVRGARQASSLPQFIGDGAVAPFEAWDEKGVTCLWINQAWQADPDSFYARLSAHKISNTTNNSPNRNLRV